MRSRKKSLEGRLVPKEEVLKALGHPRTWSADRLKTEFAHRLRPGQSELDLSGLISYPCLDKGYLQLLEEEFAKPYGYGTKLVSKAENARILASNRANIQPELERYRALLTSYEQDPAQLQQYISEMQSWLDFQISMDATNTPEIKYDDPGINEFFEKSRIKDAANRQALELRIIEYIARYQELIGKSQL